MTIKVKGTSGSVVVSGPTNIGKYVRMGGGTSVIAPVVYQDIAWSLLSPETRPTSANYADTVYDSGRSRIVMVNNNGHIWEWNGTSWSNVTQATRPSQRTQFSMAFDTARGKTVLFGGYGNVGGARSDTWEYDGTTWTQRSPATVPPARYDHTMAYDSGRGVTVMFGGRVGLNELTDTWEWNGTNWSQKFPAASPSAVAGAGTMAYDAARGKVVMFGPGAQTWEWNGTAWTQKTPTTSPSARSGHNMAYDSGRGRVVLFGGRLASGNTVVRDTWEWSGTNWLQVNTVGVTVPGGTGPMAYDAARNKMVLVEPFGDGSGAKTWVYTSQ